MQTTSNTISSREAATEFAAGPMSIQCLPVPVILSFIVMGLCVVLGGSLLV